MIAEDVSFFLNTIPPRLKESKSLRASVESLLSQSLPPKCIYVCVPEFYKRFNQAVNDEDIPDWLLDYDNSDAVSVNILTGEDYGPASRYIYAKSVLHDDEMVCSRRHSWIGRSRASRHCSSLWAVRPSSSSGVSR